MTRSIIVYGPQGCGKSLHAERLRKHYGLKHVIEDWAPGTGESLPVYDALVLTHMQPVPTLSRWVPFEDAVAALNSACPK